MGKLSRRLFLKLSSLIFMFNFLPFCKRSESTKKKKSLAESGDTLSTLFVVKNGSIEQNMIELVKMMGGIEKIIGVNDIVILKPNAQWWSQGTTNTNSMKAFIELVLDIPGFNGELIVADNHHYREDDSRGWNTEERNGDFNLNELVEYFQHNGHKNVTKVYWRDGGKTRYPDDRAENAGVVQSAADGTGYIWRSDIIHETPHGRKVMMSYPVFISPYSGRRIDFKDGVWENGKYADIPLKFINFAALNHHEQTGVTASIKHYLGICDMNCGYYWGTDPEGYWNFHDAGFSKLPGKVKRVLSYFDWTDTGEYIGGIVGTFMKTIRKADLNIITAEVVGWGGRTDKKKCTRTKALLASTDPVALDYYAAKYILLPATLEHEKSGRFAKWNNPDNPDGPFFKFLKDCHRQGIGTLDENNMKVHQISLA